MFVITKKNWNEKHAEVGHIDLMLMIGNENKFSNESWAFLHRFVANLFHQKLSAIFVNFCDPNSVPFRWKWNDEFSKLRLIFCASACRAKRIIENKTCSFGGADRAPNSVYRSTSLWCLFPFAFITLFKNFFESQLKPVRKQCATQDKAIKQKCSKEIRASNKMTKCGANTSQTNQPTNQSNSGNGKCLRNKIRPHEQRRTGKKVKNGFGRDVVFDGNRGEFSFEISNAFWISAAKKKRNEWKKQNERCGI